RQRPFPLAGDRPGAGPDRAGRRGPAGPRHLAAGLPPRMRHPPAPAHGRGDGAGRVTGPGGAGAASLRSPCPVLSCRGAERGPAPSRRPDPPSASSGRRRERVDRTTRLVPASREDFVMRTHKVLAAGAAVLTAAIVFLAAGQAADDKGPREDVDKLAAVAKDPDALHKKAEEYAKNLDALEDVMNLLKKRMKDGTGGYGIGPKPTGAPDDGIEARIQNFGKKPPTKEQLSKDKDALLQMMDRTLAIAEIALAKTPKKKEGDKDPKDWKEYNDEMIKQSKDLRKAIEAGDPKAVKDTASRLNASCTNC